MFNFHSTFNCNFILSFGDSVLFNFLTLPENRFPEITVWILTLDFEVSLYRTSDVKFHLRVILLQISFNSGCILYESTVHHSLKIRNVTERRAKSGDPFRSERNLGVTLILTVFIYWSQPFGVLVCSLSVWWLYLFPVIFSTIIFLMCIFFG